MQIVRFDEPLYVNTASIGSICEYPECIEPAQAYALLDTHADGERPFFGCAYHVMQLVESALASPDTAPSALWGQGMKADPFTPRAGRWRMTTTIPQLSRKQQEALKPATARIADKVARDLGGDVEVRNMEVRRKVCALAGEFGEENVRKAFLNADLEEHGMMPLLEPLTLFDALHVAFPK